MSERSEKKTVCATFVQTHTEGRFRDNTIYTSIDTTNKPTHARTQRRSSFNQSVQSFPLTPLQQYPSIHLSPIYVEEASHIPDSADRKTPCSTSWPKALKITARENRRWQVLYVLR